MAREKALATIFRCPRHLPRQGNVFSAMKAQRPDRRGLPAPERRCLPSKTHPVHRTGIIRPPHRMQRQQLFLTAIFLILVAMGIFAPMTAAGTSKRVLFISSYHPAFPTFPQQTEGLRSVFQESGVLLDIEFMDSKRFFTRESQDHFLGALTYKLANLPPYDVVLTGDDNALLFVLAHHKTLFKTMPIIFFGVNNVKLALEQNANPSITGVVESVSMPETIALMRRLQPGLEKITALVDGTPSGQADLNTFYGISGRFAPVRFEDLSLATLSFEEFSARLRQLDPKNAVLLLSAYRDKSGHALQFHESLELIKKNLPGPLYHLWYHGLEEGILGGKVISHFEQARTAAEITIAVLDGKAIGAIPVQTESPNRYVFDFKELKEHQIDFAHLPADAVVLDKPTSFYYKYRTTIWAAAAVLVVQALLILFLAHNMVERRKFEADLKKSERRYRKLFEASNDAIFIHRRERIVDANLKACEITGYGREKLKMLGFQHLHPVADHPEAERQIDAVIREKTGVFETSWLRTDATRIDVEITSQMIDAQNILIQTIVRDISERKRKEADLKRLAGIVETSGEAIISTALDGTILTWNRAAEKIYGYPVTEIIGSPITLLSPDNRRNEPLEVLAKVRKGAVVEALETIRKTKTGELINVSLTASPIKDEAGRVIGASQIIRDITKRKRAEKALQESERRLSTLMGNLPGIAYRCLNDRFWTMKFMSEGCLQLTGYHPSDFIDNRQHSYNDLIHPEDKGRVWERVQEGIATRKPFKARYRIHTAAGKEKWVNEQGVGVFEDNGALVALEGFITDVTDLIRAEEGLRRLNEELEQRVADRTLELRQANRALEASLVSLRQAQTHLVESEKMAALGGLVAGVAHEINTPVGIGVTAASFLEMQTKALAALLAGDRLKKSDLEKYIQRATDTADSILNNLNRAADLIKSFKQVAVDQTAEERRRFLLREYIDNILMSLRPSYKRTRHTIQVVCSRELALFSYPGAFSQIISNLIMNSMIHGFEGIEAGRIELQVSVADGKLLFRYSDNGKGMPPEVVKKIFEPFFTTKRLPEGTGLGMHIVYNLVTQMLGGKITCTSTEGEGTVFTIIIPLNQETLPGDDDGPKTEMDAGRGG